MDLILDLKLITYIIYIFLQAVKEDFKMSDAEVREFKKVVESDQEIKNLFHRRILKKLERKKYQNDLEADMKNTCSQQ